MYRNTKLLITILLLIAALLTGVRISRILSPDQSPLPNASLSQGTVTPLPITSPKTYTNKFCGVTLSYPDDFTMNEASNSAILSRGEEAINLTCGKSLPKPPLPKEKIESTTVASISATLYHDASAKTGKPVDVVILTNPKNKLEVALLGFGETFKAVLSSLRLIP